MPELPKGPIRARALAQLAPIRTDDGAVNEALMEQALAEAGDHHRLRAQIESGFALLCSNRAKFAAMLEHSGSAIESAQLAGDPGLLAEALTEHAVARCFNGHPIERDALEKAVELDDAAPTTTSYSPSGQYAQILFWSDDFEEGRPALERAVERALNRGEEFDAAALRFELAVLEWYAGNREAAERHRAAADEATRGRGEHSLDLWLAWGDALSAAGRGDLAAGSSARPGRDGFGERIGDPLMASPPTIVLASVELWSGSPAATHELVRPVRESFLSTGFGMVNSLTLGLWACDVEALIALDCLEEAQLVIDDLRSRARRFENPNGLAVAARCQGLLFATRGRSQRRSVRSRRRLSSTPSGPWTRRSRAPCSSSGRSSAGPSRRTPPNEHSKVRWRCSRRWARRCGSTEPATSSAASACVDRQSARDSRRHRRASRNSSSTA